MGKVQMSWKWSLGLLGSAQTTGNQMGETHPLILFKFGFHCAEIHISVFSKLHLCRIEKAVPQILHCLLRLMRLAI